MTVRKCDHKFVGSTHCLKCGWTPPSAETEQQLLAALKMLLKAYESVLPGLRYIAVQDYAIINDAPVAAERAIAKAEGR